ncbi:MAG TPA: aspartyl protease family protein [Streptosporangiaceae bacterium]|nr:aspartyl protease family protein [Streptosporangiaceae bacterium]
MQTRRGFLRATGAAAAFSVLGAGAAAAAPPLVKAPPPGEDGDRLFQAGQFAAADAAYTRLLRRDPRDAHAWAQRGCIALLGNRFAAAGQYLNQAIVLRPADLLSKARLADCYVRQDDYAHAVPLLHAAGDPIGATLYSLVTGAPFQVRGAGSTRLPFLTLDPLPTVPVAVNGRAASFVLDTGATFGISPDVAAAAGIVPMRTVTVNHGNGPVRAYLSVVTELTLGDIRVRNFPVMWDDTPGQPDGVLGTTIFYHFRTTLDYAARTLRLSRDRLGAPSGGAPMWLAPDHFVVAQGSVGRSGPGLMLLDTAGAGLGIVLTPAQAAQAGVMPDYSRPGTYLGVPGYPCAATVTLGRATRQDVPGAVGPFLEPVQFGFRVLGTVSHEFVKPLSLTLDFATMMLSVRGGGPAPA